MSSRVIRFVSGGNAETKQVLFQPVLDFDRGRVFGFEAVLADADCPSLQTGMTKEFGQNIDRVLTVFREHQESKCLLLPVCASFIAAVETVAPALLKACEGHGVSAQQLIVQVTPVPGQSVPDGLMAHLSQFASWPFQTALVCERSFLPGQASAALLAGVGYLKLDRSVVSRLIDDPYLQDAISNLAELGAARGARIIASAVDSYQEFEALKRAGVFCAQGNFIAEPQCLDGEAIALKPRNPKPLLKPSTKSAVSLRDYVAVRRFLTPGQPLQLALDMIKSEPGFVPVVSSQQLVGVVNEQSLLRCLVVDKSRRVPETVADAMVPAPRTWLADMSVADWAAGLRDRQIETGGEGLIVTEGNGAYCGVVKAMDLMLALADFQPDAAPKGHPLTGLPERVALDRHVDDLLHQGGLFVAILININDLDIYNNRYGYPDGDRVIQQVASVLCYEADAVEDFVAHLGGGRFSVVFHSCDWFERCERMIDTVDRMARSFYSQQDQMRGSVCHIDRVGRRHFAPFFSLAIGAVPVYPGEFHTHQEVFVAAAEVQQRAGETYGGAIYVDQRNYRNGTGHLTVQLS